MILYIQYISYGIVFRPFSFIMVAFCIQILGVMVSFMALIGKKNFVLFLFFPCKKYFHVLQVVAAGGALFA